MDWWWQRVGDNRLETYAHAQSFLEPREICKVVATYNPATQPGLNNGEITVVGSALVEYCDVISPQHLQDEAQRRLEKRGFIPCLRHRDFRWRPLDNEDEMTTTAQKYPWTLHPIVFTRHSHISEPFHATAYYLGTPEGISRFFAEHWKDAKAMSSILLTEQGYEPG